LDCLKDAVDRTGLDERDERYLDMLISGGLGLVLAALIVVGYIAYESTTHLIESNRQVTTTHRVLENLTLLRLECKTRSRPAWLSGDRQRPQSPAVLDHS